MTDLEEKFLKKNVPGKYSQWTEYQNDEPRRSIDDDDDDEGEIRHAFDTDVLDNNHDTCQINSDKYARTQAQHGSNTGVKGVLSEYRVSKQFENLQFGQEQFKRNDAFRRATGGCTMQPGEASISIAAGIQHCKDDKDDRERGEEDSSSDDSDFLDDDEFLQSYRQTRLLQVKQEQMITYPSFGFITEVDSIILFSDFIEEADSSVYCIFHLYDNSIPCCRLMNEHLERIAKEMDYCRFFRLEACKVKENFDHIGFPCILVYQGGKEVANLTPITEGMEPSLRERFTIEDVESVLLFCGVCHPRYS